MKNALSRTLDALKAKHEGALMPFLVIGDPSFDESLALVRTLLRAGVDMLEFGLAFSDPPADGPVIQAASQRARAAGMNIALAFKYLAQVRAMTDVPIALLLYYNLILSAGVEEFYQKAHAVGVDAILVADVPVEECARLGTAAEAQQIAPIFIVSERTSPERLDLITRTAKGYLYIVARAGVTGERRDIADSFLPFLSQLKTRTELPLLVGFGLSQPEHVDAVIKAGADGAIVGSALVQRIERNLGNPDQMNREIEAWMRLMKMATRPANL